jgi:hypothetical protein
MKKNEYIQPSIQVTEMMMVQTLCVSPAGSGTPLGDAINPDAVTDTQL